jgi:hypothetical protein
MLGLKPELRGVGVGGWMLGLKPELRGVGVVVVVGVGQVMGRLME